MKIPPTCLKVEGVQGNCQFELINLTDISGRDGVSISFYWSLLLLWVYMCGKLVISTLSGTCREFL